jgi:aspartate/methionine/tyrosine aminotransferase
MSNHTIKQSILERHVRNEFFAAQSLPVVQRDLQDLSADHPTMQPDQAIVDFVTAGLEAKQTHYVDVPGMPPLREALTKYLQGQGYAPVKVANVMVTAGMQEARFLSLQILGRLLGPVALPAVVHPGARKALGIRPLNVAAPLPVDPAAGYLPTVAGIQAALEGGAKVLFLESPVRLTGAAFGKDAVAEIARLANQYDAAVIWDQGLAPWVQDYVSIWNEPGMDQRAVLLGEAFPGVGIEAWYIGYVTAGNADWWEKMRRDKQAISICTATPDQLGAIKAAEVYPSLHPGQFERLAALRRAALNLVADKAVPGQAVNVLAVNLAQAMDAAILRRNGFGFADGADFGARGVIRLAVTPNNAIADALALLQ